MSVLVSGSPALREHTPLIHDGADMHECSDLQSAAVSFVNLLASRPERAVCLHCTVPTWSASSENCTDLHDLHELRSRSLVFVHDLCNKLGAAGIQVSYRLAPSHTSLVLLRAFSDVRISTRDESHALEQAKHGGREKTFLTSLDGIPSIILT
ncbi:hypothetical protein JB92DRAFT_3119520 [Gautieria morchelliformis]|nr:hypothetical protein JB92DRAFT_3119520 [Gautieria morchelliformis]